MLPCDCKDAEIGRRWREDSSLEKWFPITAERLAALEAENAALKRDLQYARDGLTKGRTRMREDNERLRAALRKLVDVEDMRLRLRQLHDMGHGTDYTDYHRLLPLAWAAAREALGPNVPMS